MQVSIHPLSTSFEWRFSQEKLVIPNLATLGIPKSDDTPRLSFANGMFDKQYVSSRGVHLVPFGPLQLYLTDDAEYLPRTFGADFMTHMIKYNHSIHHGPRIIEMNEQKIPAYLPSKRFQIRKEFMTPSNVLAWPRRIAAWVA